jgi:pyrimidine-nucleoside phosphorylase
MRVVDLIRHKRDGGTFDRAAIEFFVSGVTSGAIAEYQAAALLMAICLRGMTDDETVALTTAMVDSGVRVTYPGLKGVAVDKHSTGGVGDKTSLVLAPLVAACGAPVPMMSGRGLGHTGGTLDKLEAIPGFRTGLSLDELRRALADVGCAMIGQTAEIAPADRKLYALRDVTGTVESIPLICASIMSKKIAEGIGGLVLDVKSGHGAFMKTREDARRLARALVDIGVASGVRTEALITAMDAPLGRAVGNASEVIESIETLKGRGPRDLEDLSVALAARMLVLSGIARDAGEGQHRIRAAIASGDGVEKFREIIAHQGGDPTVVDDYARLPSAPDEYRVIAARSGAIAGLKAEHIGRAAVALGAGRARIEDAVDPGVGIDVLLPPGSRVRAGDAVLLVHHRGGRGLDDARALLDDSIVIEDAARHEPPIILEEVKQSR